MTWFQKARKEELGGGSVRTSRIGSEGEDSKGDERREISAYLGFLWVIADRVLKEGKLSMKREGEEKMGRKTRGARGAAAVAQGQHQASIGTHRFDNLTGQ
jgi:hypothetical protein